MTNVPEMIVGFDFGDSETAIATVQAAAKAEAPQEIISTLGNTATGIIQTVVGRLHGGGIVVGSEAANTGAPLSELHVGFKTTPREEDLQYKELASAFLNEVGNNLISKGLVDLKSSRFVFGHPTRWKSIDKGSPVEVFKRIIRDTCIGEGHFEVVPESRAALVQALNNGTLPTQVANSGWVLVIDVGSSTTDFTAVDLRNRKSDPVDYGDEIGARLIDRAIYEHAISNSESADVIRRLITTNPSYKGILELFARAVKEAYFSTVSKKEASTIMTKTIVDGGKRYHLVCELNQEIMHELTLRKPIATFNGRPLSWAAAFKETLESVKGHLQAKNYDQLSAIVLTGGASRMDFISYLCEEVFPDHAGRIRASGKPSFDIAYGLARWGRLEVQTSAFIKEVDVFCTDTIPKVVEERYPALLAELASAFQAYITEQILFGLRKWKNGGYATINGMQNGIKESINKGLEDDSNEIIREVTAPWINEVIFALSSEIAPIEDRYAMRRGVLSTAFTLNNSAFKNLGDAISLPMDYTGGASDLIGGIVAVVAGIVSFILAANIYPIVILIVAKIIAVVSVTLATGILAILGAHPVGWAILLAAGITGAIIGREAAMDKLKEVSLPLWVREKIVGENVEKEIREKSIEIKAKMFATLQESNELRATVEGGLANAMGTSLRETAEEARLLIN